MKRCYSAIIFIVLLLPNIHSQDLERVQTFPYDQKLFTLVEKWDVNEGMPGGPGFLGFQNNSIMILGSSNPDAVYFYSIESGKEKKSIDLKSYGAKYFPGRIVLGTIGIQNKLVSIDQNSTLSISEKTLIEPREYTGLISPQGDFYISGNMIFAGVGGVYFSWEKRDSGPCFYRDPEATRQWLKENCEQYGYLERIRSILYLGENGLPDLGLRTIFKHLNVNRQWIMPKSEAFQSLNFSENVYYIGQDAKGLAYYYTDNFLGKPGNTGDKALYSPSRTYIILDPWSMKVVHRTVPGGQYKVLQRLNASTGRYYPLGCYGQKIHPLGDVYLFSANTEVGGFDLMRLKNTWWAELGLEKAQVGQILGNRIPLYAEAKSNSEILAYNYENEYVKIIEESKVEMVHEGQRTLLVKVQKLTGAIGWIPKAVIYVEPLK